MPSPARIAGGDGVRDVRCVAGYSELVVGWINQHD